MDLKCNLTHFARRLLGPLQLWVVSKTNFQRVIPTLIFPKSKIKRIQLFQRIQYLIPITMNAETSLLQLRLLSLKDRQAKLVKVSTTEIAMDSLILEARILVVLREEQEKTIMKTKKRI